MESIPCIVPDFGIGWRCFTELEVCFSLQVFGKSLRSSTSLPYFEKLDPSLVSFFVLVNVGIGQRKVSWTQTGEGFECWAEMLQLHLIYMNGYYVATSERTCWEWRSVEEHIPNMHRALGLIPSTHCPAYAMALVQILLFYSCNVFPENLLPSFLTKPPWLFPCSITVADGRWSPFSAMCSFSCGM